MESAGLAGVGAASEASGVRLPREVLHGVILAGAHPWAERILERAVCRPLVPIASRPLICHTLDWLRSARIQSASVCANSDTVLLRRRLRDGASLGVALDYHEDVMPRGPAGCARDVAAGSDADTFLVVEGSVLPRLDLADLLSTHASSEAVLTVVVATTRSGSTNGRALVPVGVYVFSRSAFEHVPAAGYQDIKETLIPRLYAAGKLVATYVIEPSAVTSVTGLRSYLAASESVLEQRMADDSPDDQYVRCGEAWVHHTARIAESVQLLGPVLIERGCTLADGVLLVGPVTLGPGCHIGRHAVVTRSVIWAGCRVGDGAVLDHCILTDGASAGAGHVLRSAVIAPEQPPRSFRRWLRLWCWAEPAEPRKRARRAAADDEPERMAASDKRSRPWRTVRSWPDELAATEGRR